MCFLYTLVKLLFSSYHCGRSKENYYLCFQKVCIKKKLFSQVEFFSKGYVIGIVG